MSRTAVLITPGDSGRPMSLEEFRTADTSTGDRYELGRGVITVTNVPNPRHFAMTNAARRQLTAHDLAHPGEIFSIASGGECKILLVDLDSERHPDLAVYKSPFPTDCASNDEVWSTWIPELVIEIVSPDSAERDYHEKPEEYLRFGVPEYWVIDETPQEMLVLRRSAGQYRPTKIPAGQIYRPSLFKGLEFDVAKVFAAAGGGQPT